MASEAQRGHAGRGTTGKGRSFACGCASGVLPLSLSCHAHTAAEGKFCGGFWRVCRVRRAHWNRRREIQDAQVPETATKSERVA